MYNTYTTINPQTGNFTKENEFINAWKWDYDLSKIKENSFPFYTLKDKSSVKEALVGKYYLHESTRVENAFKIHDLIVTNQEKVNVIFSLSQQVNELLETVEIAAKQNKDLKTTIKKMNKNKKSLVKDIVSYLIHKEECNISKMKIVGRTNRTKCNCGLLEILEK